MASSHTNVEIWILTKTERLLIYMSRRPAGPVEMISTVLELHFR